MAAGSDDDLLARARAIAAVDKTDVATEALLSAASDLVAWGAFEDAGEVLSEIESRGEFPHETRRLRKAIERFRDAGPEYEARLLTNAIRTADDLASTAPALLAAAESLLRWGDLDTADRAIDRLTRTQMTREAASLKATSRQLRRSGVLSAFSPLGHPEAMELNRPYEALVARGAEGADKTVVVFTGAERKFWLSIQVLYHFLRKLNAHVIYLNDHSSSMFLNGLESIGGGYKGLLEKVSALVGELGTGRLYVMGGSAGGYVGLRAAADLSAVAYLGFGIRTALMPGTRLPLSRYDTRAIERCNDKDVLGDLRSYLAGRRAPRKIVLYCGDGVRFDAAHAENLRGLPNVELKFLERYPLHNVIPGLIARGLFETELKNFVSVMPRDAAG